MVSNWTSPVQDCNQFHTNRSDGWAVVGHDVCNSAESLQCYSYCLKLLNRISVQTICRCVFVCVCTWWRWTTVDILAKQTGGQVCGWTIQERQRGLGVSETCRQETNSWLCIPPGKIRLLLQQSCTINSTMRLGSWTGISLPLWVCVMLCVWVHSSVSQHDVRKGGDKGREEAESGWKCKKRRATQIETPTFAFWRSLAQWNSLCNHIRFCALLSHPYSLASGHFPA